MKARVLTTARADNEARRATAWWRENRPAAPHLFEDELAEAIGLLAEHPDAGRPVARPGFPKLRALLLERTQHHLYYDHDAAAAKVVVRAVWGAVRGRPPRLQPKRR